MIDTFRGEYAFLSNFYNARIKYNGRTFMSSEAAFQSEKTLNEAEKDWFVGIGPVKAKALGRKVHLRPDWDDVKVKIMLDIVRAKFKQNAWLAKKLLATGNEKLVEGNSHGDDFWGVPYGRTGENHLGRILMLVRTELRTKSLY